LATEETLSKALERDLELAQNEFDIANAQQSEADGWGRFWAEIVSKSQTKVA
jgi:hypothetical protein